MNARQLTDAQIAEALRTWVPDRAQAGLRDQVLETAGGTTQQRPLPSFLGSLSDAGPVARQRSLLIAAALLLALAVASAAAVGALRLLQSPAVPELSLDPPADVQAFVLSLHERLTELPPVALTWVADGSGKGRIYVDRSGAVRFEQYASAEAMEPVTYRILSGSRIGQLLAVGSERVWVPPDHDAISDDPRWFLNAELGSSAPYFGGPGSGSFAFTEPGCETARDPDEAGNETAATGWTYVGAEYIAGRPAHHVACAGGDLWLDSETLVILKSRRPVLDDADNPIPGAFRTVEVTEIEFGEQPAALFTFTPPEGVTSVPAEEVEAYRCARDPVCAAATPEPDPTPQPTSSPTILGPHPSDAGGPGPLAWTETSLEEDWPAPVRAEPVRGATVHALHKRQAVVPDPSDDIGSVDVPWVDIRKLDVFGDWGLTIQLATNLPPVVDPSEQWIAYGVVTDDDRDGIPDRRFGMDNLPATEPGRQEHRAWMTDLHTGRTDDESHIEDKMVFGTSFPGDRGRGARLLFRVDTTGGPQGDGLVSPFYAWASVIENGRVVATDYAPDLGWLDPRP